MNDCIGEIRVLHVAEEVGKEKLKGVLGTEFNEGNRGINVTFMSSYKKCSAFSMKSFHYSGLYEYEDVIVLTSESNPLHVS